MLSAEQTKKLVECIDKADYYKSLGDYKSAIVCYEEFLKIDASRPAIYSILANLYDKAYGETQLDKQLYYYNELFKLSPNNRIALHGLAFCYEKKSDKDNAKKFYELLLQNSPTDTDYYNYGMFLIQNGDFVTGHKYFTKRFNISDNPLLQYPIPNETKIWDFKTDLSDKTLLVHYEQGFGDTIMYCRFIPELKKLCKKLVFVVQNELYELICNSSKISEGIEIKTSIDNTEYDYSMALLDAPYILKTTIQTIPYCDQYIDSNAKSIKGKYKIGIAYSGDKTANYNSRNLTLHDFEFLNNIDRISLYSLQKDESGNVNGITPLGGEFKTFSDTAQAIKAMDLVVSTDNVILNLAGALGVKTVGLFNQHTNYRWFKTQGDDVGWYNSVYPLQCKNTNEWNIVLDNLTKIIVSELT